MKLKEPIATLRPSELKMESYAKKACLKKKSTKKSSKKTTAKKGTTKKTKKKNLSLGGLKKMFN